MRHSNSERAVVSATVTAEDVTAEDVTAEDVTAAIAEHATAVIVEDPKVVECAIGAETRIRPT